MNRRKQRVEKTESDEMACRQITDQGVAPSALVSPEERAGMIAVAAYTRAEMRGFEPGHELDDWLAAEKEVEAALEGRQR